MNKLGGLMVATVCLASGAALADKAAPVGKISAPVAAPMTVAENPCTALTPAAIQGAIDRMDQARAEAQLEYNAYGTSGGYPAASQQGLDYITQAMNQMVFLRDWLHANVPDTPFVDNTTGVYNVHWYARAAAWSLAYGEHWSAISAVYNHSLHGKAAAELATQANTLLADIGGHGIQCYMHGYFP